MIYKVRISSILNFRGSIMGSLKNSCRTFYSSLLETIALNCLVFEKIVFCVRILAVDRQANGRANGWTAQRIKPPSQSRAAA